MALAAIDLDVMRLPNAIVLPAYPVLAALLGVASVVEGTATPLLRAAAGALLLGAGFLALALSMPGGMGMGDVKLAGLIGAVLGFLSYPALVLGAFAAFVIGAVFGLVLVAARGARRRTHVPFGPAMIAGALVALFATGPLVAAYQNLTLRS